MVIPTAWARNPALLPLEGIQVCPESNDPGMLCVLNEDGKVVSQGKLVDPEEINRLISMVATVTNELSRRDKEIGSLKKELKSEVRKRDSAIDQLKGLVSRMDQEAKEYREKNLALEERKLATQTKQIDTLETQNDRLSQVGTATHELNKTIQQNMESNGSLMSMMLAVLAIGFAALVFFGIKGFSKVKNAVDGMGKTVSETLNEQLGTMRHSFELYFQEELARQNKSVEPSLDAGSVPSKKEPHLTTPIGEGSLPIEDDDSLLDDAVGESLNPHRRPNGDVSRHVPA